MSTAMLSEPPRGGAVLAIGWGGFITGALDITAAFLIYPHFGLKPIPLLQGIAAGALGARSFQGGLATAALGLFFQFFIAYCVTATYYAASRKLRFLVEHAILWGTLYGIAVYFFMNRVVVSLSAARKYPFSWKMMAIGLVIHIFCVGLPVALSVRRFS